jgi:uncharacterized protein YqhQ
VSTAIGKVRLGGMALRNGILVHSFDHWAAAVRTDEGEIRMASGRKPGLPDGLVQAPVLRGVARLAEVAYLRPVIRLRLPEARLPMEAPGMAVALAGSVVASQALRRSRLSPGMTETLAAAFALLPAMAALRGSQLAGYHGAEHKAIGGYEQDTDAIDVAKEHERCGSHMIGPLLAATAVGNAIVARLPAGRQRSARLLSSAAAIGVAGEAFGWMSRHRANPVARMLARPGFQMQRLAATREPTVEELEVARTALDEVLRLEGAAAHS